MRSVVVFLFSEKVVENVVLVNLFMENIIIFLRIMLKEVLVVYFIYWFVIFCEYFEKNKEWIF